MTRIYMPTNFELAEIKASLSYDPASGVITWIKAPTGIGRNGKQVPGAVAGVYRKTRPYLVIGICGRDLLGHRVAWYLHYGDWPKGIIDHKDGDPSNNRIDNIRLASQSQNMFNTAKGIKNTSGYKGVFWKEHIKKWTSEIRANGKRMYLGVYATAEEADAAYRLAAAELHGEFRRFA